MKSVLVIEDDDLLRDGLCALLGQSGYQTISAADAESAQLLLAQHKLDGLILDLGLPKMDGLELLSLIRAQKNAIPILILTARDSMEDRVAGLNLGADDYLSKPFSKVELQARVSAMLRRAQLPTFIPDPNALVMGSLRLDCERPQGWLAAKDLELTHREWSLLKLLVEHQGRVVGRDMVALTWAAPSPDSLPLPSNALEVYIHRLRRKLQGSALTIRNVRGLGYMLELDSHLNTKLHA